MSKNGKNNTLRNQPRSCINLRKTFLTLEKCGPLERIPFMREFRTVHIEFWAKEHPSYADQEIQVPAVVRRIFFFGKGHHLPKDTEHGPSRTRSGSFDFEVEGHAGTYKGRIQVRDILKLKFFISPYAACFVGKVCDPLWSTWGARLL